MKALACLVLAACALTSHAPARELRYFTPERVDHDHVASRPHGAPRAELRLGRITASANLRYAIVHRDSSIEIAPYETLRWTELPDAYVRRALQRALFDDRALAEAVSRGAPTLDLEVTAFEELTGPRPAGRVVIGYELHDEKTVLARGTVAIERAATSSQIEAVVAAIRGALTAATSEIADRVEAALIDRAGPAPDERYAPDPARSTQPAHVGSRAPALH